MYSKANSTLLKSCAASARLLQKRKWISGWLRPKNGRGSDYRAIMGANH